MGTPEVARDALEQLVRSLDEPDPAAGTAAAPFYVAAVVTQPPAPSGRRRSTALQPSPVHQYAEEVLQVPVYTPGSVRHDEVFLHDIAHQLAPDLVVTAAYGQWLPTRFLHIAPLGTLNIHPSLLPQYRGAAPVQRALLDGVRETGVSIVRSVREMDAGPIVLQERVPVDEEVQAPQLLQQLFLLGARLLAQSILRRAGMERVVNIAEMDALLGTVREQQHAHATHAPKLGKADARLTFCETATRVHNRVRALAGWPGTWVDVQVLPSAGDPLKEPTVLRLKVICTRVVRPEAGAALGVHEVHFCQETQALRFTCDDGSQLDVLQVQLPGKRVMQAREFWNGLRGQALARLRVPY